MEGLELTVGVARPDGNAEALNGCEERRFLAGQAPVRRADLADQRLDAPAAHKRARTRRPRVWLGSRAQRLKKSRRFLRAPCDLARRAPEPGA